MSRWYRAYEGTCTDPKLAEAALDAGCSRSVAIAAWHLILENACAINDGGRLDISPRRIAAALCEPLATIEMLHSSIVAIGLTDGSHVSAWKRRQYESDSSTDRSRRHRAAKKVAETLPLATDATLHGRCATPPETETETDVPLPSGNGRLSASDMTKAIFDSGVLILTADGERDARAARSIIGRWRKGFSDSIVLTTLSRCQSEQPSEPIEWMPKALQLEARKAAGNSYDANIRSSGPARAGQRSTLARAIDEGLDFLDRAQA
jgi:hypothetical protein